eukprot:TRINITY_DN3316_c0_g1_i5.p1 TRINITY_DN3316_c0_g1~~TRINITY_DN3316_c0_g1_i5.p1  ORF type:complete len:725 (-),score=162.06 TRINITY_DN3316_c0_g1_i5:185-2062(-)
MAAIKAKIEAGMRPCDFPGYAAIARHFPQAAVHKTTRSGMPVTLELYGRADVQKLLEEMTAEEFFVYGLHRLEYLRLLLTNIAKTKGVYKQVCVVSDLGGLGWRHMHMPFINALKVVSLAAEEHYREQVGTVLVLNTNMVFSAIWKIVQPILNERTIAKIKIPAKSETEQVLQTYIDPADTPELLGGRCTCPATGGCLSGLGLPFEPVPATPAAPAAAASSAAPTFTVSPPEEDDDIVALATPVRPTAARPPRPPPVITHPPAEPTTTPMRTAGLSPFSEDDDDTASFYSASVGTPSHYADRRKSGLSLEEDGMSIDNNPGDSPSVARSKKGTRLTRAVRSFKKSSGGEQPHGDLPPPGAPQPPPPTIAAVPAQSLRWADSATYPPRPQAQRRASFETALEVQSDVDAAPRELPNGLSLNADGTFDYCTISQMAAKRKRRGLGFRSRRTNHWFEALSVTARKLIITWFLISGLLHMLLDGIVVSIWAAGEIGILEGQPIWALSSVVYSGYDARFSRANTLITTIQIITVFVNGPMALLTAHALRKYRPWWSVLACVNCTIELYGRIIAMATNYQVFARLFFNGSFWRSAVFGCFYSVESLVVGGPLHYFVSFRQNCRGPNEKCQF